MHFRALLGLLLAVRKIRSFMIPRGVFAVLGGLAVSGLVLLAIGGLVSADPVLLVGSVLFIVSLVVLTGPFPVVGILQEVVSAVRTCEYRLIFFCIPMAGKFRGHSPCLTGRAGIRKPEHRHPSADDRTYPIGPKVKQNQIQSLRE